MNRRVLRFSAIIGAAAVSTLAAAPAFAATAESHSSAQSLVLQIAGTPAIAQETTADNDGSTETVTDNSTVPSIASVLPANNLIGAGVLPQKAVAKPDGTSYACAGLAGTGGGIVTVGDSACNLNGQPLTLDLANLNLGNVLLGNNSALGSALNGIPGIGDLLGTITGGLNTLVTQISGALASTPLGEITIGGSLSAVQASCTADPTKATGDTRLVDTTGGSSNVPIQLTLPGLADPVVLASLPANPPVNHKVVAKLSGTTQIVIDAIKAELEDAVGGALQPLGLGSLLQQIQDTVIVQATTALQPLLDAISQNLLEITLNKQVVSEGGKKIDVTALTLDVLPAAQQFTGSSLISGEIGKVSCGPNARTTDEPTTPSEPSESPEVPTVVDSGVAGNGGHAAQIALGAVAALMALAGGAGLVGYRRSLTK